ncbi:hypothetical protein NIES4075_59720 [Tolypothrix sp. NIES-4075]|nr:hypothetical protein NIES4075_59720 [Tolypothrix sp. NIES-4075]
MRALCAIALEYNKLGRTLLSTVKKQPMTYTPSKLLSFEEFITQYGDNTRYELIEGELREMEPTSPHEAVAGSIAGRIYVEIFRANFNWEDGDRFLKRANLNTHNWYQAAVSSTSANSVKKRNALTI